MTVRSVGGALCAAFALGAVALAQSQGGMELQFLGLADGSTLVTALDPSGSTIAIPVRIRVTGPAPLGIGLTANEVQVGYVENGAGVTPFEVEFLWVPAWGAGSYTLEAGAINADKSAYASARVVVTVSGVPAYPRPPAPQPYDEARARVIALYQERFGISLAAPALARKERYGVLTDPWVSTAWIGNSFYQVNLFPDGRDESWRLPVEQGGSGDRKGVPAACRPEGTLSMLVVFLDYGNLGIAPNQVLPALQAATARLNELYAAYPRGPGSAEAILRMETTGVVIAPPPGRSELLLSPGYLLTATGIDPSRFKLVGEVDLDATNTARHAFVTRGEFDTFGLATGCCPCAEPDVDVWVGVDDRSQLTGDDGRLLTTLLSHEVMHYFGYGASHDWPCTDGTTTDASDSCGSPNIPALFLGWTDTDGDGVPELSDPTPYGSAPAK